MCQNFNFSKSVYFNYFSSFNTCILGLSFSFCSKVRHDVMEMYFMIGLKLEARGNNWSIIKLAERGEGGTLKPMQARKRTRERLQGGVDIFWDGHL